MTILGVAGAFTFAQTQLDSLRIKYTSVNAQYEREAERLKRLDVLQKQQAELARRAKLAEALIERSPRTEMLASLTALMPGGTSLMEVVMNSRVKLVTKTPEQLLAEKQSKAPKKTDTANSEVKPKLYDTTLKVVGIAYTDMQVADYINSLGHSPYFEDVNLLVSREITHHDQSVRRFEVEMVVRAEPKANADASVATSEEQAAQ